MPSGFWSPARLSLAIPLYFAAVLALDTLGSVRLQLALGGLTLLLLLALLRTLTADHRARVIIVVVVASCFEVIGSLLWGVYRYRLGNLPAFVPPGHGLVYLAGLSISQTQLIRRRSGPFVWIVLAIAASWGILGLTGYLGRLDAVGALGVLVFGSFLLVTRAPTVLAGVFVVVAALEIYGTALGTWTWAATVPGLHLPDGNPPSGVASGYVMFDVIAIALAPFLLAGVRRLRGRTPRRGRGSFGSREPAAQLAANASADG